MQVAGLEAQAKQDGLPMEVVASLDEASRRKLVEKLNGHCQCAPPPLPPRASHRN